MSYDLEIGVKVHGLKDFTIRIAEPTFHSPTYNLGVMFRKATGWNFKQGEWYLVADVLPKIEHGLQELRRFPEKYRQYEPENKWGTVESAIDALNGLAECIYEIHKYDCLPYGNMYVRW